MEELAERAGVALQTVWRIETGQVRLSFARTLRDLATALGCDFRELMRAVSSKVSAPLMLAPDELQLSPEDLEDLPDPSKLPPEPLRPDTIERLYTIHRAEAGRRFIHEARIEWSRVLPIKERVAIKRHRVDEAMRFDTTLFADGVATRVHVYTNDPAMTDALQDAMDHRGYMRLLLRLLVVESTLDYGTVSYGVDLPKEALGEWTGFSWPDPEPNQMWCLLVIDAERMDSDDDRTNPG